MLKKRTSVPYWHSFAQYQSFNSIEELFSVVNSLENSYDMSETVKSVLNTIKLHAQTYFGACWLKREEIASKAKVSLSSVKRAIRVLKDNGIIQVIPQKHTVKGCDAPNVYVISNPYVKSNNSNEKRSYESTDPVDDPAIDPLVEPVDDPPYKDFNNSLYNNSHSNFNNKNDLRENIDKIEKERLNNFQLSEDDNFIITLKNVPLEFVSIMKPYYSDSPEIILQRWKSTCIAIKKCCFTIHNTSWETIEYVWKVVVNKYKRNLIDNAKSKDGNVDDAIGGYYYSVLCDYLLQDYLQLIWGKNTVAVNT